MRPTSMLLPQPMPPLDSCEAAEDLPFPCFPFLAVLLGALGLGAGWLPISKVCAAAAPASEMATISEKIWREKFAVGAVIFFRSLTIKPFAGIRKGCTRKPRSNCDREISLKQRSCGRNSGSSSALLRNSDAAYEERVTCLYKSLPSKTACSGENPSCCFGIQTAAE